MKKNNIINKVFFRSLAFTLAVVFSGIAFSGVSYAGSVNCYPERDGSTKGSPLSEKCPPLSLERQDIGLKCLLEASEGKCLDIVPAADKQSIKNGNGRIPENLCQRSPTRPHNGMDYAISGGAVAAADGVIITVKNKDIKNGKSCYGGGEGRMVAISHARPAPKSSTAQEELESGAENSCFKTQYFHLASISVKEGDKVKKGDTIGTIGGSGCVGGALNDNAYGTHLHFEIQDCLGAIMDPMCPDIMKLCGDEGSKEKAVPKSMFAADGSYVGIGSTKSESGGYTPLFETEMVSDYNPHETCRDCKVSYAKCPEDRSYGSEGFKSTTSRIQQSGSYEAVDKKCRVSDYRSSFDKCIFCDVFLILFNVASEVSARAFNVFTSAVMQVVLIGTAIWIAFTLLLNLSSFKVIEQRVMLQEIMTKLFVVFCILVFLSFGHQEIFNLFLAPIFNTGMKFSLILAENSRECGNFAVKTIKEGGGIPETMGQNILCSIKAIQDMTIDIMSVGSTFICVSWHEKATWKIIPHFGYLITGVALWLIALLFLIIYPWLLVDSILKITVSCALLPVAVGAYAFKITQKYAMKVFSNFFSAMLNFVFLTMIIFILLDILSLSLGDIFKNLNEVGKDESAVVADLFESLAWWTVGFLQLGFVVLLGWAVLGDSTELADEFNIVGEGLGFSQNIGAKLGGATMDAVKEGSKSTRQKAWKGVKQGAKATNRRFNSARHNLSESIQKGRLKKSGKVDSSGNLVSEKTSFLTGKKTTKTLIKDAGGREVMETKVVGKKSTTITKSDNYITASKKINNKTGEVYKEDFKINAASAQNILDKRGKVNPVAIQGLLKKSGLEQEVVLKAMMHKVLEQRHGDSQKVSSDFKNRSVSAGLDGKGRTVFTLSQISPSGKTQRFNMTLGDKRIMTSFEEIGRNGNSSIMKSDGIINRNVSRKYDEAGGLAKKDKETFSSSNYYAGSAGTMDSLGKMDRYLQEETMFSKDDLHRCQEQVAKKGRLASDSGFFR